MNSYCIDNDTYKVHWFGKLNLIDFVMAMHVVDTHHYLQSQHVPCTS